jgi:16S rRNA (cytosine967-C5)-methyltransferase
MAAASPKGSDLARPLSLDMADAAMQIAAIMSRDDQALAAQQREKPASPAVSDLVYRGLRHWGLAKVRLSRMAKLEPDKKISALLAIAWAALHEQMREPHTVIDQAVNAAKKLGGPKAAGFVNALLRNTSRDPAAVSDFENPVAKCNAPLWWIEKIKTDWGTHADSVLSSLRARAPLTVRLAAGLESDLEAYLNALRSSGLEGKVLGPAAISIDPPVPVDQIPGFASGKVSVQDASAQAVLSLFDVAFSGKPDHAGFTILDACAAPGGKTIALAQRYPATIWAIDKSLARLSRLNADRARVAPTFQGEIRPVVADVLNPESWPKEMPAQFDAILLDAPCSASGVVRRHPEIPWKRTPDDIQAVADIQRQMLDVLWARVKPGGELAFVTCSVFLEEGEAQARSFLERTSNAISRPSPGRLLPLASPETGRNQDGFFFAKFQKTSASVGVDAVGCRSLSAAAADPRK